MSVTTKKDLIKAITEAGLPEEIEISKITFDKKPKHIKILSTEMKKARNLAEESGDPFIESIVESYEKFIYSFFGGEKEHVSLVVQPRNKKKVSLFDTAVKNSRLIGPQDLSSPVSPDSLTIGNISPVRFSLGDKIISCSFLVLEKKDDEVVGINYELYDQLTRAFSCEVAVAGALYRVPTSTFAF